MKNTNLIHSHTQQLLDHLQIAAKVEVNFDDQSGYYHIQMETDNPGLIIGYRGETLAALQLMLSLLVNRGQEGDESREWNKLLLNVNDYRQRREETLQQLAQNAAQKVKYTGEPYYFENLSPSERRAVHIALQEDDQIETFSEGEGHHRRLAVVKKQA
jgi:spoIIIJ-associated protein